MPRESIARGAGVRLDHRPVFAVARESLARISYDTRRRDLTREAGVALFFELDD
jgi:hypothetical protein